MKKKAFNSVLARHCRLALGIGGVAAYGISGLAPAIAQAPSAASTQLEEVVVTGTLIRGVAPVGTNVSSLDIEAIQRSGAASTNQILSQIPEITNAFNVVPVTPASLGRSTFRPDLRNLGATGSATTLVLVDGHNLVGAGILQTTPDAGAVPPGAIERVEVVADGGSSIYGSDAIGGIVNFITRRRFEGLEFSAHGGFGDNYDSGDVNVTGGWAWDGGSALVSVMSRYSDELSAADRNLPRQDLRSFGGSDFRVRTCPVGTIIANNTTYALPGRVPGTTNLCDTALNGVITPKEKQNSGFVSVTQELGENLDLEIKLIASQRKTDVRQTQISNGGAVINNTNPFFQSIAGETQQTVALDYSSVLGPYVYATSDLSVWDVTPTLTYRMDNGWRAQAQLSYGWSNTEVHVPGINSAAETAALRGAGLTTANALNPYNPGLSAPLVVYGIANFENYATSEQELRTVRISGDGPLFDLSGGPARLAVGAQYQEQQIDALSVNAPRGVEFGATRASASRGATSVFAQLVMPVIEPVDVDLSVRHDNYDDVGGTTNFKIGANWEVVDGLRIRGNYGTAFNAPSLADSTGAVDTRANIVATTPNIRVGDPAGDRNRPTIQLAGGNPDLQPQTADTWSFGIDFTPAAIEGLELSATYWSVTIEDSIGIVPAGAAQFYTIPAYSSFYILRPTLAQAQAATQGMTVTGASSVASLYGIGNDPYILTYQTRQNLGTLWVDGLDARVSYRRPASWGQWYATLTGTKQLKRETEAIEGAAIADILVADRPKFQGTATVGGTRGAFSASARMNYTSGFDVAGVVGQTSVGAFHPIDLTFSYQFGADFDVNLNINNAFDTEVPYVNRSGGTPNIIGFQINSTLGRIVNIGLRKRF